MTDPHAIAAYFRLMNANALTRCYHHAEASGLLTMLSDTPRDLSELAEGLHIQSRPLGLLLRVLASAGVASESERGWSLTALGRSLHAGPYRRLGDEHWDHLPALLVSDEPAIRMDEGDGERAYVAQASALLWMCAPAAQAVAREHASSLPPDARVLDLGAGSAVWSLAVLQRATVATAVAIDRPSVLSVADRTAQAFGLRDRLMPQPGDLFETPLPNATFDLVIVANVLHLLNETAIVRLLERCRTAMTPRGELWLIDVVASADPLSASLYELGLALRTKGGRVHLPARLAELCATAGLSATPMATIDAPPGVLGLLRARAVS